MLIATPNLCLDRTERLAELVPGAVARAREVTVTAGGKGVNVARVARAYRRPAILVGLTAEHDRERLLALLAEEGADVVGVPAPGHARMAVIMLEDSGRTTVLNEPGSTLDGPSWARYRDAVSRRLADAGGLLVCSGSLPPGAPVGGYAELVELARVAGVATVVDSAPGPLRASLAGRPDLVTPNLEEAEAALGDGNGEVLVGVEDEVAARAAEAARRLCELGAGRAAVTAGVAGVAFHAEGVTDWVPAPKVDVVSAVGAGDSFVAGLALALADSGTVERSAWLAAVLRGVATASASCEVLLAGGVDPERVAELLTGLTSGAVT
ncbi:1-phosphofructokinase family hexose kinase [Pseudonocardia eucalypti]|uniref:1-phosphofructokinase family hexose kinase n=1 Tax=Pseudonocardia eucalypti TaxID=648755 RepID=A0ABP9R1X7_9PSEU|nr:1-phosphofructokinase family hexose kinase [Pseudonocardia eucalypti]